MAMELKLQAQPEPKKSQTLDGKGLPPLVCRRSLESLEASAKAVVTSSFEGYCLWGFSSSMWELGGRTVTHDSSSHKFSKHFGKSNNEVVYDDLKLSRVYATQTQSVHTLFLWAKMQRNDMKLWNVNIMNTPPWCIVHCFWTCHGVKLFAPEALPLANIWYSIWFKLSMCFSQVPLFAGSVQRSESFVPTATIFSLFFATLSWIQRYLVCTFWHVSCNLPRQNHMQQPLPISIAE